MSLEHKSEKEKLAILENGIQHGKHVFLLIFMEGCGPCIQTKPKWYAFESKHGKNPDYVIVNIEKSTLDSASKDLVHKIGGLPGGFPCMRHIHRGAVEEYEKCEKIDKTKLRTLESFQEWFKAKTGSLHKTAHKHANKTTHKKKNHKHIQRGGKWSLKYKRSINCKRPRGFSQRQHCKYGRKSTLSTFQLLRKVEQNIKK